MTKQAAKVRWAKIQRGEVVELGGREWTVEKIEHGKKKATVKIRHKGNVVRDKVALTDKVRVVALDPLVATRGRPQRQRSEPAKAIEPMPPAPPTPATGSPWETQNDRIEAMLGDVLRARLVGESVDGAKTYYVPPVDVTTIASHLTIFHDGTTPGEDEFKMLERHANEHAAAERGKTALALPHWHTEQRPTEKKK